MNEHDERRDQRLPANPADENDPRTVKGARKQSTRTIIWVACALYLLYLSYQLLTGILSGEVERGGISFFVICAACVLFAAVAVFLLVRCVRTGVQSMRETAAAMAAEEEAERLARLEAERGAEEEYEEDEDAGYGYIASDEEDEESGG